MKKYSDNSDDNYTLKRYDSTHDNIHDVVYNAATHSEMQSLMSRGQSLHKDMLQMSEDLALHIHKIGWLCSKQTQPSYGQLS